jgi:hypothetical protein
MYLEGMTCLVKQIALNRKQPALFQDYAAVYMSSSFFCDVTQRRLVVRYRRFGTDMSPVVRN